MTYKILCNSSNYLTLNGSYQYTHKIIFAAIIECEISKGLF